MKMFKNFFLIIMLFTAAQPVYAYYCQTVDDLLLKYNIIHHGNISTKQELKAVILNKLSLDNPAYRQYHNQLINDLRPDFNHNYDLSYDDIRWADRFFSSDYLNNFNDTLGNRKIQVMDQLPTFDAKYKFAKKVSDSQIEFLEQIGESSAILLTKGDVTKYASDLDGLVPLGKEYKVNDSKFLYIESENKLIVSMSYDESNVLKTDYLDFKRKNFDGELDAALCFDDATRTRSYYNAYQRNNSNMDIEEIFNHIKNNEVIKEYLSNPTGMCFDTAQFVGEILNDLGIDYSNIRYRLIQSVRNGLTWEDVNINYNDNHMVVVLTHKGKTYVIDPTIIQYVGIYEPFYGLESDWRVALQPSFKGVKERAVQYFDYPSYSQARNGSIKYRMDFDKMTTDGGSFINHPQWYKDFYIKYNSPAPVPSKKPKFLMCLRPKTMD